LKENVKTNKPLSSLSQLSSTSKQIFSKNAHSKESIDAELYRTAASKYNRPESNLHVLVITTQFK
jgi:hypothetical protein